MEEKKSQELVLEVPSSPQSIESFILDLEQSSSGDDSLSVEVAIDKEHGGGDGWNTFTLVDSEGFPLLTVILKEKL